jgi:Fic family protein
MRIETCKPKLLPLNNICWKDLVALIGDARAALATLDCELRKEKNAAHILEPLRWLETMASLRSQKNKTFLRDALFYHFTHTPSSQNSYLQKIDASKKAFDAGIRFASAKRICLPFFCRLHSLIKKNGAPSVDTGHFRSRQNWIGVEGCPIEDAYFYPPRVNRVRPLLRNLDNYLTKKDLDPAVHIAIAFAQFLIIHPFMDGNGRVARILIPLIAAKKNLLAEPALFMSAYFEKHRLEYFQKLFWISDKNAWEGWINFFLKGVIEQTQQTRAQFISLQQLWHRVARFTNEQTAARLFHQPFMKKQTCSQPLIRRKMLVPDEKGYYLFQPLITLIEK